jgi:L-rhamnose mutarotase
MFPIHEVRESLRQYQKQTIMKRFAFKMYLKPGCEVEYAKRHAAIWPEMVKMIKENQGVSNYSIFWDKETNLLFAYQECNKDINTQDTSCVDPITQKWWNMMADLMDTNKDNSPVSVPLEELFHLE